MKKDLLEHLIRTCVKEVLEQVYEADDTLGAPAPPAAGQGTADQPPIGTPPATPPMQSTPPAPAEPPPTQGLVMINPRDPAKLQSIELTYTSESQLERDLQNVARRFGGQDAKRSLNSIRLAKDGIQHPSSPTYFYIGKYDPESEEKFLMADKDLNTAKENSISSTELGFIPTQMMPNTEFEPIVASPDEFASRMSSSGATPRYGIDELKKAIKKIVKEVFTQ